MEEFFQTVARLRDLSDREVRHSRYAAEELAGEVRKLKPVTDGYSRTVSDEALGRAKKFLKLAVEDAKREGIEQFGVKAREIANDIDRLRVLLPQLAAQAAVDLGAFARDLRGYAERGEYPPEKRN
ncbi:MAG: hypothetical protein AB7F96_15480 [Beijerinckiaceae bacterium]